VNVYQRGAIVQELEESQPEFVRAKSEDVMGCVRPSKCWRSHGNLMQV